MIQKWKRRLCRYPLVFVFFVFLFGFSVFDALWPKRDFSDLENRPLQEYPQITLKGLASNKWMQEYEAYVKDQFALRDTWIDVKSRTETALLKTENNDVWFGADNYLFAKQLSLSSRRQYNLNIGALGKFAERNPDMLDVMIVPSASLILRDKLPLAAPVWDEGAELDALAEQLEALGARYIDVRDTLTAHKDEYIYYRTDHHWTTAGAYLAYRQYAELNGKPVFDVQNATAVQVEDFYGTNYSKARPWNAVPDTLTYYDLPNRLTIFETGAPGTEPTTETTLYETAQLDTRDKYAAFLHGNKGYEEIEGDGTGSVLVVKDSYANCFVPYLTASYAKIGVVDYRASNMPLSEIVKTGNYDRVLVLYSFDSFTSDSNFGAKLAAG